MADYRIRHTLAIKLVNELVAAGRRRLHRRPARRLRGARLQVPPAGQHLAGRLGPGERPGAVAAGQLIRLPALAGARGQPGQGA
jgi:hypothetical protein